MNHTAQVVLSIQAAPEHVWEALTNPEIVALYFYGTQLESTWEVGSPILFKGSWEGQSYLDKGTILSLNKPFLLSYNYLSSWSNLPDVPESYQVITYALTPNETATTLTITQEGFETDVLAKKSEENWTHVLSGMKSIVEQHGTQNLD